MTICEFFKKNLRNLFRKKEVIPIFNNIDNTSKWNDFEVELYFWINNYRVKKGFNELKVSLQHHVVARARAKEMPIIWNNGKPKNHKGFPKYQTKLKDLGSYSGENIAYSFITAHAVFMNWLESETHEKLMIDKDAEWVGFGKNGKYISMVTGKQIIFK